VIRPGDVEIGAADGAQSGAIWPAEHLHGERQGERIARPVLQVEQAVVEVGRLELLALARLRDLARIDLEAGGGGLETAHARTVQLSGEAQAQRIPIAGGARDVETGGKLIGRHLVALAGELEGLDRDRQLEAASLAAAQMQPGEVEAICAQRHRIEVIAAPGAIMHGVSRWFRSYGFAEVDDRLLAGAYPLDADDVDLLASLSVNHVLNLVQDDEYRLGQHEAVAAAYAAAGIGERRLDMADFGHLPPEFLEAAVATVVGWLEQPDGATYVHCRAGWQRSAAVAAGVVAIREGLGVDDALAAIRRRKPSADPLPHQVRDLHAWWDART
jgi:protein-tyrosine phosphatase